MENVLTFATALQMALVPLVIALAGLVKLIKGFNTSYTPIVAIVLGIALSLVLPGMTVLTVVLGGIIVGLTACGLYSATSSIKNADL